MEINNLPGKRVQSNGHKNVHWAQEKMKEHSENFNKEIKILKKTILEGVNSRLDVAEEWISDLKDRLV